DGLTSGLLDGFTISGGNAGPDGIGGGLLIGLSAPTTLSLANLDIRDNTGSSGAGLFNAGTVTLTNVSFSGNRASIQGGGMYNAGTATLTNIDFWFNLGGL